MADQTDVHKVTQYKISQNPIGRKDISASHDEIGEAIHERVRGQWTVSDILQE
jgi:hypothetical protein